MADPADIARTIRRLSKRRVLVGIPQENNPRSDGDIGNAALAYIHNYGSPLRNIPARPFMEPGIAAARPEIDKYLRAAAEAALAGNETAMNAALAHAGTVAADRIKLTIQAGIPPPLQPESVRRRRTRTPGSSYRRKAQTAADVTPLIDTGALLRSITYIVRDK
jgi:hypothetical protein